VDRLTTHSVKSVEAAGDGNDRGRFRALVSVFGNVDAYGDVVEKGAFTRTLSEDGLPPIVWSHQWSTPPVGATLAAEETDDGLVIDGQLFVGDVQLADSIYAAMSRVGGDGLPPLRQFSFGYDVRGYSVEESDHPNAWAGEIRRLTDLKLHEVGPCLVGVNPDTELLDVKGVDPRVRPGVRDARPPWSTGAKSAADRMDRAAREHYVAVLLGRR